MATIRSEEELRQPSTAVLAGDIARARAEAAEWLRMMDTEELVALELAGVRLARSLGYLFQVRDRTLSNAARAFIALLEPAAGS